MLPQPQTKAIETVRRRTNPRNIRMETTFQAPFAASTNLALNYTLGKEHPTVTTWERENCDITHSFNLYFDYKSFLVELSLAQFVAWNDAEPNIADNTFTGQLQVR